MSSALWLVTVFSACGAPVGPWTETGDGGPSASDYLGAVIAPELMQYAHLEVLSHNVIKILPDDAGIELTLFAHQPKLNNGVRAEVAVDFPFVDGDRVSYEWRLWLAPEFTPDAQNRWWVLCDFHDQPDPNLGQTWADYPAHSAPLIIGYGHLDPGTVVNGFSVDHSSDVLGVTYGTDYRSVGLVPIPRDEWVSIRLDVTWSQSASGSMTMWVNGQQHVTAQGPNMLNAYQQYFKAGQYRNPDIATTNRVRLSNIKIRKCAASGC